MSAAIDVVWMAAVEAVIADIYDERLRTWGGSGALSPARRAEQCEKIACKLPAELGGGRELFRNTVERLTSGRDKVLDFEHWTKVYAERAAAAPVAEGASNE